MTCVIKRLEKDALAVLLFSFLSFSRARDDDILQRLRDNVVEFKQWFLR